MTTRLLLIAILVAALSASACADVTSYYHAIVWDLNGSYTDLGTLSGGTESGAYAISQYAQVTGWATNAAGVREAVRWDASGAITDLGTGVGYSINGSGQVAGESNGEAMLWDADGKSYDIGPGVAYAVNNGGRVVGCLAVENTLSMPEAHAFVWSISDGLTDLGKLSGSTSSSARAINDSGAIAGGSIINSDYGEAFLSTGSTDWTIINDGWATSINESGQVTGNSMVNLGFLWTPGSGSIQLGMTADSLNEDGVVAGTSTANNAAIWTLDAGVTELAEPAGCIRSVAHGINDAGQVAGWAMLVPDPSPISTLIFGLCGLASLGLVRRVRAASR